MIFFRRSATFSPSIQMAQRLSLLLVMVVMLVVLVQYFRIQPQIPLFYSLARPQQSLVAKEWLFLFPVLSITMFVVHSAILRSSRFAENLLITLFAWSSFGTQLLIDLALFRIIMIVT